MTPGARTTPAEIHIAARVKQARIRAGLSQEALAARIGLSFQQVQKYESAGNRISAGRLLDIANALALPPAWFFEELGAAAGAPAPLLNGRQKLELIRYFAALPDPLRNRIFHFVKFLAQHPDQEAGSEATGKEQEAGSAATGKEQEAGSAASATGTEPEPMPETEAAE